jgi:ABC-type Fe3+-hydroxamate transport system substrate-binding protein
MKKRLCILLGLGLFALAGCGSNTTSDMPLQDETTTKVDEATTKEALESTTTTKVEPTKTVYGEKGTIGNPYSVSEALEIIGTSASFSNEKIYVTGIVSEKPYYDEKHKSYSAYLIDSDSYGNIEIY